MINRQPEISQFTVFISLLKFIDVKVSLSKIDCMNLSLQTPVVVDPDGMASFDLIQANEHIHESEVSVCQVIIRMVNLLLDLLPKDKYFVALKILYDTRGNILHG